MDGADEPSRHPTGSGRGGRGGPSEDRKRARREQQKAERVAQQAAQASWMPNVETIAAAVAAAALAASLAMRRADAANQRTQACVRKHLKLKQLVEEQEQQHTYMFSGEHAPPLASTVKQMSSKEQS